MGVYWNVCNPLGCVVQGNADLDNLEMTNRHCQGNAAKILRVLRDPGVNS